MARLQTAADVAQIEADVQYLLKTEGLKAAATAMIAVCKDPKAPAQARATASRTIFEVTGSLKKAAPKSGKQLHEMTSEELGAELARINRLLESGADDDEDPEAEVFG